MNNKVLIPFAIAPMLLASCKTHSFVGRYSFMMGKANDSHIGIVLELTDKDYEADPTLGKVFSLSLDSDVAMKGGTSSLLRHDLNRDPEGSSSEETSSEESSSESSSESPIDSLFGGGDFSLSGYYTIGEDKNKDGNYPLNLGARLLDPEEFGSKIVIPDEIVGDIVVAEINKTSIQATIPVSVTDLIYQLYWYGWDISIDIENLVIEVKKSSGESHEHGTHPTKEDVERINKTFPEEHLGFTFRDFDCLTMGLTKESK